MSVAKHWCLWPYLISCGTNHRSGANVYYSLITVSSATVLQGSRNTVYSCLWCCLSEVQKNLSFSIRHQHQHGWFAWTCLWWDLWVTGISCYVQLNLQVLLGKKKKKNTDKEKIIGNCHFPISEIPLIWIQFAPLDIQYTWEYRLTSHSYRFLVLAHSLQLEQDLNVKKSWH